MDDLLSLWLSNAANEQRKLARATWSLRYFCMTPSWIAKVTAMAEAREEAAKVFERRLSELSAPQEKEEE